MSGICQHNLNVLLYSIGIWIEHIRLNLIAVSLKGVSSISWNMDKTFKNKDYGCDFKGHRF